MDPHFDKSVIDRVLLLQSLWHKDPNRTNPTPSKPLQLYNSTEFKKSRKYTPGLRTHIRRPFPDIEWPCNPSPEIPLAWPELKTQLTFTVRLPTAEEKTRFASKQIQQRAMKASRDFFSRDGDSDGEDNEDDDDDMTSEEEECEEEYHFWLKLFTEDNELRGYYDKSWESGEFYCLVCGGVGKKLGKRFKGCVALVQHSITIAKTNKRRAHRDYGQAICNVLGWDMDRLPTRSLHKPAHPQQNFNDGDKADLIVLENNVASVKVDNGENVPTTDSLAIEVLPEEIAVVSNAMEVELMVCEDSITIADAKESIAEGMVNGLCKNLTRTMVLEAVEMK